MKYKSNTTLTAGQLIEQLKQVNPNTPVILENEDMHTVYTITSVQHYNKCTLICACFETYTN